ncbi:biotin transporter BioY [Bifidobacterium gallicum]|nr:biotin transporter BioY [Bifidobacterium gallicum]KFI59423.1 BioY family protein [Bifidobacterium gallicum DSM 20093 = LMG 11596]
MAQPQNAPSTNSTTSASTTSTLPPVITARDHGLTPAMRLTAIVGAALLLWAATAAGRIPVPGTPVPITLQTFVVMMMALLLGWRNALASVVLYLTAGACGLPVFSGGMSIAALIGPSCGFLYGFVPAVVVTGLLASRKSRWDAAIAREQSTARRVTLTVVLRFVRNVVACLVGCVGVLYVFGIGLQSFVTGMPVGTVALASMGFIAGDVCKAIVAAAAASGLSLLNREQH